MADKKAEKKPADAPGDGAEPVPKKKSRLVFLVMLASGVLVLMGGAAGGALYFTGFFSHAPVETAAVTASGGSGGHGGADSHEAAAEPDAEGGEGEEQERASIPVPDAQKFNPLYKEMDRAFTMNVRDSRRFVQFKLALMTYYDQRVIERVTRHEVAIRSAALAVTSQYGEQELMSPEGRERLRLSLRDAMNDVLLKNEGFGGIQEVFFTEFVFQ
jgi:flagellar FliL protein